jgi:hypothetical protein
VKRLTNHPTVQVDELGALHRKNSFRKGYDCYAPQRVSQKMLRAFDAHLSARDKTVLLSVQQCQFLTTGQIQRLHFIGPPTLSARIRATNRVLTKLHTAGLLSRLPRRIGGVRAGSSATIWRVSAAGQRFLCRDMPQEFPRKRLAVPTTAFLQHSLAVAELFVRLKTATNLQTVQFEPECWRGQLKPDLYAVAVNGGYEDHWFFEVDRDTEAPSRVVAKCRRYVDYYRTGVEQQQNGVFPLVVWVVPDEKRKNTLEQYIATELQNFNALFQVKACDEFSAF